MALTECYVDYTSGSDTTGDGTSWANAYKTLQGALDNFTPGADGTRFNILAGESNKQVLAQTVDWDVFGKGTSGAPIVIEGCTSTPGDGGTGWVDGNGSYGIGEGIGGVNDTEYVWLKDLKIYNGGSANLAMFDVGCKAINCEFYNTTGDGINAYSSVDVLNCYFHDIGGNGIETLTGSVQAYYCLFCNGASNQFSQGIHADNNSAIRNCMFYLDSTSDGVLMDDDECFVINCSFFTSGTGDGIKFDTSTVDRSIILNCLFEGFANGIDYNGSTENHFMFVNNSFYNCTNATANKSSATILFEENNEESLTSSPFAKNGSVTWANRYNWFRPVDVGNVLQGAWPYAS